MSFKVINFGRIRSASSTYPIPSRFGSHNSITCILKFD